MYMYPTLLQDMLCMYMLYMHMSLQDMLHGVLRVSSTREDEKYI